MLTPGEALDKLSRTIALQRTHKRGAVCFPEIAGGSGSCDNADICAYLTDPLGTQSQSNFDSLNSGGAIYDNLISTLGYAADVDANVGTPGTPGSTLFQDLGIVANRIGIPSGTDTLTSLLNNITGVTNTIESGLSNAITNYIQPTNAALPYPNSQANDVHADINRAIASIILANALLTEISAAVTDTAGPLGDLLQVIGIIFPNHSGGTQVVNYNTSLVDNGAPPPIDSLTAGTTLSLGTGAFVSIPAGTYGYRFSFTVPPFWARRGDFAEDLSPSIARLDWARSGFSFNNPKYVRQEAWLAFPLHPAANEFTIDLANGVTGTYTPLLL